MNEISWKILGDITEIHLSKVLTHADIETFKTTNRKYQNVKFTTYASLDDVTVVGNILEQVSSIASINLHNITLKFASRDVSEEMQRVLQPYADGFKSVTLDIDVKDLNFKVKAEQIRSLFPKAVVTFIPYLSPTTDLNYDEVNTTLQEPREVLFRNNLQKVKFNNNISNVKTIAMCCDLEPSLEHFKSLQDLEIEGKLDMKLLETTINDNKTTLRRLKITQLEGPWTFEFPCQMKELTSWFSEVEDSSSYADVLKDQRHLRYLFLNYNQLTNDLLDVLSKNTFLTTVEFSYCTPEESLEYSKFDFLNNVSEISFTDVTLDDLTFVNAIIDNSKKVRSLLFEVDMLDEDPDELDLEATVLENLQVLQVNGMDVSRFIARRIQAPNLEVCSVDCYSDTLLECKHLRNLTIVVDELDYERVVNMLEALQSLEVFYFVLQKDDFEKTFKYILENLNNIKHFRLDLFPRDSDTTILDVIESTLKDSEISWTKCMSLYQTESFSFEIQH